jgi:hypothetical protein
MQSLVFLLLNAVLLQSQLPTVRAKVDLVVVPTSVQDSKGKPITNLSLQDFQVFEDGRREILTGASIETSLPSIEVIRDRGLNAGPFVGQAKLVKAFSDSYAEKNRENDVPRVERSLEDALFTAADELSERAPQKRKVIVAVVTRPPTGGSPSSLLLDHLMDREVQVYFVLTGHFFPFAPTSILRAYAEPTGGSVFRATDDREMQAALSKITDLLRNQYLLTYVSDNPTPGSQPAMRRIEVRLNRPGFKTMYRRSYLQIP